MEITSCRGRKITETNIHPRHWDRYLPVHPNPPSPSSKAETLRMKDNVQMRAPSYVNTRNTYSVPLILLQKYSRDEMVSKYCLTLESVDIARAACKLSTLPHYNSDERHEDATAVPSVSYGTIRSGPSMQARRLLSTAPVGRPLEGSSPLFGKPAIAQQALLPLPAISVPRRVPVQLSSTRRSHQPQHNHQTQPYHRRVRETPNSSLVWVLLRTLLVCFLLCVGSTLLALLGYSIYLGLAWLLHAFTALLTAIKIDLVAFGKYSMDVVRNIASPFQAVGKGITAFGKSVAHLFKETTRWIRGQGAR